MQDIYLACTYRYRGETSDYVREGGGMDWEGGGMDLYF